jgi:4-hydroxy-3-polyprenylbenzoate decarboxylase
MAYDDLNEWLATLEKEGELAKINKKVDWDLEIGGIVQENFDRKGPALLFENIKDHEDTWCRKLFTASLSTYSRIALALGLAKDTPPKELIKVYSERVKNLVKPVIVDTGPVKEIKMTGDKVDMLGIPAPKWHHRDGGRFVGTCDGVVTKDPESGWVNIGLYRRMVHDRNHTGLIVIHGQHIWRHWRNYKKLGHKTMPVAVVNGWDPVLPFVACSPQPPFVCEYDIMGALRQKPVELVKCETIDLEVPASAQIVYEGEVALDYDTFKMEGPFGEYCGYYQREGSPKPVFSINCITHRNDPIFQGTLEGVPINEDHIMESVSFSALIWNYLNEQMIGVTGVNADPSTAWANVFIQIDNSYVGQVFQAASLVWGYDKANFVGKNIIIVDQDIDIFDLNKVMWAWAYRVDPKRDYHFFPGLYGASDPTITEDDRVGRTAYLGTKMLIDATKWIGQPRTEAMWGERFPPTAVPDEETMKKVRSTWKQYGINA